MVDETPVADGRTARMRMECAREIDELGVQQQRMAQRLDALEGVQLDPVVQAWLRLRSTAVAAVRWLPAALCVLTIASCAVVTIWPGVYFSFGTPLTFCVLAALTLSRARWVLLLVALLVASRIYAGLEGDVRGISAALGILDVALLAGSVWRVRRSGRGAATHPAL